MNNSIDIQCADGSSSKIVIGSVAEMLPGLLPEGRRVVVVTDANVHRNNREFVDAHDHIIIGQGETSKTLNTLEELYRNLMEMGADRNTFVIGMGGGIVTDITGFAASTYMRGMDFGFIPTTLLGQVDAGIGGKNGVNLDGYKNVIGLFSQPRFVICDPAMLRTLADREFRSGLAEIIKAGVIGDPKLFGLFEDYSYDQVKNDPELLGQMVRRAIDVKVRIVEQDEHEKGERRKLNLGHTFAHAIEKSAPGFSHGEAVAAGMAIICEAAVRDGKLARDVADRICAAIEKMGLPVAYPVEMKKLLNAVKYDKKRDNGGIYIVYPVAAGSCETIKLQLADLERILLPQTEELSA